MIMEDNKKQINISDGEMEIELSVFIRDLLGSFFKLWWLTAVLAAVAAVAMLVYGIRSYKPIYKAEATFTVETRSVNQSGYNFFYDNNTAAQMAKTFPYLLDSDLLLERVKADLGTEVLNGTPSAQVIENSNLFTLSVTSRDAQAAYDILQALIHNYPAVAEYVIGKTQLNMIAYPEFPSTPYNSTQHLKYAGVGAMIGFILGMGIVVLHAMLRNTVRKEADITEKLHSVCLGTVPLVVTRAARKNADLSIHNNKVGTPFKESVRGLALQTARALEDRQVLLITATAEDEGATTVARTLTEAFLEQGKQVCLLEGEDLTPTQIRQARQQANVVVIDAPVCQKLSKLTPIAEQADAILYVIRQDYSKLPRIMNCFEDLNHLDARLIGCVLTGVRSGITGYGYGYGYGYGKGYRYGYGYGYGYGEEKAGKFTAENE